VAAVVGTPEIVGATEVEVVGRVIVPVWLAVAGVDEVPDDVSLPQPANETVTINIPVEKSDRAPKATLIIKPRWSRISQYKSAQDFGSGENHEPHAVAGESLQDRRVTGSPV
jgi:hypothetical protein